VFFGFNHGLSNTFFKNLHIFSYKNKKVYEYPAHTEGTGYIWHTSNTRLSTRTEEHQGNAGTIGENVPGRSRRLL
jgi:hypothetical protein